METEYAVTRLSAIKGRLPSAPELIRMLETAEMTQVAEILRWSAYGGEMDRLAAKGTTKADPARMIRVINEGSVRLRSRFGDLARTVDATLAEVLLLRWEVEEVKSAMRYLSFDGFALDRRFSFNSLVLPPAVMPAWGAYRSAMEFVSLMRKAGHPLAPALDARAFANDPAEAELAISRRFYLEYLPAKVSRFPEAFEYHRDRLDIANVCSAALLRDAPGDRAQSASRLVIGPGVITRHDIKEIVEGSKESIISVVKKRLGVTLKRGAETSATILSMSLRRAFYRRLWMKSLLEPTGLWSLIFFMEYLDANAANLKLAISFAASHTPIGEAAESFIRV
ncbi:MAG: V-type ATPase subunit [Nitrospinae bacterium]|nr:V-type ATPase subunit [Nitrospinota bacterium]